MIKWTTLNKMEYIEGKNISKSFKKRTVLKSISLKVYQGEIIGLLGPNGAGKTTTFTILIGFLKPDLGNIYLNDREITNLPIYLRARCGISYLPQEPSIFKNLSIFENLYAVLEMYPQNSSNKIEEVLKEMGLDNIQDRKAYKLSGGERRRLEIARALLLSPKFLLLDEPFAGIDPIQIKELQDLIIKLKRKNLGIIITDHNVREILKITDRSYILNKGEVIFEGISEELILNKRVKEEYLGKEFRWN